MMILERMTMASTADVISCQRRPFYQNPHGLNDIQLSYVSCQHCGNTGLVDPGINFCPDCGKEGLINLEAAGGVVEHG